MAWKKAEDKSESTGNKAVKRGRYLSLMENEDQEYVTINGLAGFAYILIHNNGKILLKRDQNKTEETLGPISLGIKYCQDKQIAINNMLSEMFGDGEYNVSYLGDGKICDFSDLRAYYYSIELNIETNDNYPWIPIDRVAFMSHPALSCLVMRFRNWNENETQQAN